MGPTMRKIQVILDPGGRSLSSEQLSCCRDAAAPSSVGRQVRKHYFLLGIPPYLSLTVGSNKEKEKQETQKVRMILTSPVGRINVVTVCGCVLCNSVVWLGLVRKMSRCLLKYTVFSLKMFRVCCHKDGCKMYPTVGNVTQL